MATKHQQQKCPSVGLRSFVNEEVVRNEKAVTNYMNQHVILVDQEDRMVGTKEKLAAHQTGQLHRAFSIFVFNSKDELLIQKRANLKYHSRELWSNTCCGHPRPGESVVAAAHRRLSEEMGFDCNLNGGLSLIYNVPVGFKLYEHEYNHVLIGHFEGEPNANSFEVSDWKWIRFEELTETLKRTPNVYTAWLPLTAAKVALSLTEPVKLEELLRNGRQLESR